MGDARVRRPRPGPGDRQGDGGCARRHAARRAATAATRARPSRSICRSRTAHDLMNDFRRCATAAPAPATAAHLPRREPRRHALPARHAARAARPHGVRGGDARPRRWRSLPEANCDVLISDIGLPDGNGWELMRAARRAAAALRDRDERLRHGSDRERSLARGFRHHLVKPIDLEPARALLDEAAARPCANRSADAASREPGLRGSISGGRGRPSSAQSAAHTRSPDESARDL